MIFGSFFSEHRKHATKDRHQGNQNMHNDNCKKYFVRRRNWNTK